MTHNPTQLAATMHHAGGDAEIPDNRSLIFTPEAIVSVLDAQHHDRVLALWDALQREFGVSGVYETPIPHCSYHVAETYDMEALSNTLEDCARQIAPFRFQTAGLGIFTGPQPVLYIAIVRNVAINALHATLWQRLRTIARVPSPHYLPERWLPHITLTIGDVDAPTLGAIITHLSTYDFHWDIAINNLAVICDNCGVRGLNGQFTLTGDAGG